MQHSSIDETGCAFTSPAGKTKHRLICADARDLSFIEDTSVQLVVTSPPYWTLKEYHPSRDAGRLRGQVSNRMLMPRKPRKLRPLRTTRWHLFTPKMARIVTGSDFRN